MTDLKYTIVNPLLHYDFMEFRRVNISFPFRDQQVEFHSVGIVVSAILEIDFAFYNDFPWQVV